MSASARRSWASGIIPRERARPPPQPSPASRERELGSAFHQRWRHASTLRSSPRMPLVSVPSPIRSRLLPTSGSMRKPGAPGLRSGGGTGRGLSAIRSTARPCVPAAAEAAPCRGRASATQPAVGRKIIRGDVKENRAAATAHAWTKIVAHDADGVIERVLAPHFLMAEARRRPQRFVIKKRARIVAPEIMRPRSPPWQMQGRRRAQVKIEERPAPGRARAVAFALVARNAAAAERARKNERPGDQPSLVRAAANAPRDAQQGQSGRFRPVRSAVHDAFICAARRRV